MAKNNILYRLSLDSTTFQNGLKNAEAALKRAERQVGNIGKTMTTYVTAPLTAMAGVSVMAWDKQAKAMAQVEQGLKTTGGAAGFAKEELFKMASDLQNKTLFGDEEILQSATAQLLTFTNIAGDQFAKAQSAALDLATRLDGDLKGASIMVGKALNDPIQGLTALRRVGVSFTDSQQAQIRAMTAAGNIMGAQKIILAELERQYGGSAEAAVVGAGKITQLKNSVGDLMEEFGRIIMDYITPLIDRIKEMVTWFQGLDESTKRTIVVLGGLASAIGPVMLGIAGLIKVTRVVMTTMAGLMSPVTLVIAGLAALSAGIIYLWQNWAAVKERISDWAWWRNTLVEMTKFVIRMAPMVLDAMSYPIRKLAEVFGVEIPSITSQLDPLLAKLDAFKTEPKKYENAFGSFGEAMRGAAREAGEALGIFKTQAQSDLNAVTTAANNAATALAGVGGGGAVAARAGGGTLPKMKSKAATGVSSTSEPLTGLETEKLTEFGERYKQLAEEMQGPSQRMMETMQAIGTTVGGVFDNMGNRIVDSLGLAENGFEGFVKGMISTVLQLISMMLAQSIANSIAGATASGLATGPAAIFSTPAFIATAVGGVLAAFAAIPKFASGGLAYGPTLAMVGDNKNAKSDPEIIAPLSKLRGMMGFGGGMMVQDRIEIDGTKLYVVLKRVEQNNYLRT